MEQVVKMVAERAGISEEAARTAVTTVVGFLKERLPAPIAGQLDSVIEGGAAGEAGGLGDVAGKLGGMFGGGENG